MELALRPRLEALAALVLPGLPMLDVGTDHGLLPAALVVRGRVPRAIASDLRREPVAAAAATIARLGVGDRVVTCCADGLRAMDLGEVASVVIAGVGPELIVEILAASPERRQRARRLVLGPITGASRVRRWLVGHGYVVVDERLVEDRRRFYAVIAAEVGTGPELSEVELEVGPVVLARGGPVLARHLRRELTLCSRVEEGLLRAAAVDRSRVAATRVRRELLLEALAKSSRGGHPGAAS